MGFTFTLKVSSDSRQKLRCSFRNKRHLLRFTYLFARAPFKINAFSYYSPPPPRPLNKNPAHILSAAPLAFFLNLWHRSSCPFQNKVTMLSRSHEAFDWGRKTRSEVAKRIKICQKFSYLLLGGCVSAQPETQVSLWRLQGRGLAKVVGPHVCVTVDHHDTHHWMDTPIILLPRKSHKSYGHKAVKKLQLNKI